MTRPSPAELHQFAREERARRKAAWQAGGQAMSDRAQQDDIIWSNIEQKAGRFAGDPSAMRRAPWYWTKPEIEVMTANARATAIKAETGLAHHNPANAQKIAALWHIYRWLRSPDAYRPTDHASSPAAQPADAIASAALLLHAQPAGLPHHWEVPGKPIMSTGQMLFLAADLRFAEREREAA